MEVTGKTNVTIDFSDWSYEEKCGLLSAVLEGETWEFDNCEVTIEVEAPDWLSG
jgi:hypothetical protein